jgi:hypothetical protein
MCPSCRRPVDVDTHHGLPTVDHEVTPHGSIASVEVGGVVVHRCLPTDDGKGAFPAARWKLD